MFKSKKVAVTLLSVKQINSLLYGRMFRFVGFEDFTGKVVTFDLPYGRVYCDENLCSREALAEVSVLKRVKKISIGFEFLADVFQPNLPKKVLGGLF